MDIVDLTLLGRIVQDSKRMQGPHAVTWDTESKKTALESLNGLLNTIQHLIIIMKQ